MSLFAGSSVSGSVAFYGNDLRFALVINVLGTRAMFADPVLLLLVIETLQRVWMCHQQSGRDGENEWNSTTFECVKRNFLMTPSGKQQTWNRATKKEAFIAFCLPNSTAAMPLTGAITSCVVKWQNFAKDEGETFIIF